MVALQSIKDPLEIDQDWLELYERVDVASEEYDLSNDNMCRSFINDCLLNVYSNFKFDTHLMEVQSSTTLVLKVRTKPIKEAGYFPERYQLNIYEGATDCVNFIGCQVRCFTNV